MRVEKPALGTNAATDRIEQDAAAAAAAAVAREHNMTIVERARAEAWCDSGALRTFADRQLICAYVQANRSCCAQWPS